VITILVSDGPERVPRLAYGVWPIRAKPVHSIGVGRRGWWENLGEERRGPWLNSMRLI
jgi:hypothetical protein